MAKRLESSQSFFTHMSGTWVGMTWRLRSTENVNQSTYIWLLYVAWASHSTAAGLQVGESGDQADGSYVAFSDMVYFQKSWSSHHCCCILLAWVNHWGWLIFKGTVLVATSWWRPGKVTLQKSMWGSKYCLSFCGQWNTVYYHKGMYVCVCINNHLFSYFKIWERNSIGI